MMRLDLFVIQSVGVMLSLVFVLLPIRSMGADTWQGKVINAVDGAILDIMKPDGQTERVHLYAITVPTGGHPGAMEARARTLSWCHQWGDMADVIPMGLSKDGHALARVIVGQDDLADVLTKACLAEVDMDLCRERKTMECAFWNAWQLQCRDEKKGIWASQNE